MTSTYDNQTKNTGTKDNSVLRNDIDSRLGRSANTRLPVPRSKVPPLYRETTKCYAYMCQYSYGCTQKTNRPAQVPMRKCIRYMPKHLRIRPALSQLALDLLAKQRQIGKKLTQETTAILDEHRPDGPLRDISIESI